MSRVLDNNEYSMIRIYQSGTSSDAPYSSQTMKVALDADDEKDKPDFSKLFHSALADVPAL